MVTARPPVHWGPVVLLESANVLSGIGNGIVVIAIPLLVLRETGSAALYGLIAVLAVLPSLVALPFVGAMIDRYGHAGTASPPTSPRRRRCSRCRCSWPSTSCPCR